LLGGTLGFPGDGWDGTGGPAPFDAPWRDLGEVRHTFTHFHLTLRVLFAEASSSLPPLRGSFHGANLVPASTLPTLMRKALALVPPLEP
jgi:A/G-specific adenine glycosylase